MRWGPAIIAVVSACGRFHFDPVDDGDAGPAFRCAANDISVGTTHTCAVDSVGAVWCWGSNKLGESVPGGGPRAIATPTRVELPATVVQVAAGWSHSCARFDDGSVWCWGDNSLGQLGNGGTAAATTAVPVQLGGDRAIDLDAGSDHTCVRRELDAAVVCWGANHQLQAGVAGGGITPTPMVVAGTAGSKQLDLGHRFSCAVDASDRAVCWGNNIYSQLGSTDGNHEVPMPIGGLSAIERVSSGGSFVCAIEIGGNLRCWGRNDNAQLGTLDTLTHPDPQPPIITDALDVQIDNTSGCAVRSDHTAACWDIAGVKTQDLKDVTQLSLAFRHRCAVASGGLTCWGQNSDGELGRGTRSISSIPIAIPIPGVANRVAVGFGHVCAVVEGTVWCWGRNFFHQGGVPSPDFLTTPASVASGLPSVEGIDGDRIATCAWGGGAASCWGSNGYGQLGIGAITDSELPSPVTVTSGIVRLAAGRVHTCAQIASGVVCWGYGSSGELGNGMSMSSVTAVPVSNLPAPITDLSAKFRTTCTIANGGVWCWGYNSEGQIGDGTQNARSVPVQIAVPGTAARVGVSEGHACALNIMGELYCWGRNGSGELGLGDTAIHRTPTRVTLPEPATQIAAGFFGTCVGLASGSVMCWGKGDQGENATGDPIDDWSPRFAPGLAGATMIARNYQGGCAVIAGNVSCWGQPGLLARGDDLPELAPAPPELNCP